MKPTGSDYIAWLILISWAGCDDWYDTQFAFWNAVTNGQGWSG